MLYLELIIVIVLHTEDVSHFWFTNIYTFVGVRLLIFLYAESSSVG